MDLHIFQGDSLLLADDGAGQLESRGVGAVSVLLDVVSEIILITTFNVIMLRLH